MQDCTGYGDKKWTLTEIANATNGNANTLRSWLQRGLIVAAGSRVDKEVQGPGLANLYSTFTAIQMAVMVALNRIGVSAEDAAIPAAKFAHSGAGPGNPNDLRPDHFPERDPGCAFADGGITLIAFCPDTKRSTICKPDQLEGYRFFLTSGATVLAPPILLLDGNAIAETATLLRYGVRAGS